MNTIDLISVTKEISTNRVDRLIDAMKGVVKGHKLELMERIQTI